MSGRPSHVAARRRATSWPYADAYERCRAIHRQRGRSYYWATSLLSADRRRAVHAVYAYTRIADDIVDGGLPVPSARRRLTEWGDALREALAGRATTDPVLPAVADTIRTYGLDLREIDQFLTSMSMDLSITGYGTYAELLGYMEGSSAVIGTLMLPILGLAPGADAALARRSARELGFGFQLTNFIRDVAEDLDRGRVYLPQEDLDRFGVTVDTLTADARRRSASAAVRELVRFECARALAHYAAALPGIALLEPRSRICIRAAFVLYGGILCEVARAGYDVFARRAIVPPHRRLRLLASALSERTFAAAAAGMAEALTR